MPIRLFEEYYYLLPHKNLCSVLAHGILSRNELKRLGFPSVDISDPEVQCLRARTERIYGRQIHDYAPLYINPKNPMLYVRRDRQHEFVILVVSMAVLTDSNHVYTDGNAAVASTVFSIRRVNSETEKVLKSKYWSDFPDGKRRRCAEVLVYPKVAPEYIMRGVCSNPNLVAHIQGICKLPVSVDSSRSMFF